jgi:hypothetical protein
MSKVRVAAMWQKEVRATHKVVVGITQKRLMVVAVRQDWVMWIKNKKRVVPMCQEVLRVRVKAWVVAVRVTKKVNKER